jgi:hypothetical protein
MNADAGPLVWAARRADSPCINDAYKHCELFIAEIKVIQTLSCRNFPCRLVSFQTTGFQTFD